MELALPRAWRTQMRSKSIVIKLLLLLASVVPASLTADEHPLKVCELLESPCLYQGRMVLVEGEERPGGHGPFFSGQSCDRAKLPTTRFLDAIVLTLPPKDDATLGVTVAKGLQAEQAEHRLARRAGFSSGKRVFVTYEGVFQSVQPCKGGPPANENPGYGEDGFASSQLLIQRLANLTVR
jgi:hypothetical protein